MLVKHQKADGHWECPGGGEEIGPFDPFYSTTLNALALQVYYRYLPSYKEPTGIASSPEDIFDFEEEEL